MKKVRIFLVLILLFKYSNVLAYSSNPKEFVLELVNEAITVLSNKSLRQKLKKVINAKGNVICELVMDPDEEQIPKAINRRDKNGKSVPTKFEDMYPFLSKDEIESNKYKL